MQAWKRTLNDADDEYVRERHICTYDEGDFVQTFQQQTLNFNFDLLLAVLDFSEH